MMRRGWVLWADWCAATGRAPLPVTEEALAVFEHDLPRVRLSDIRATVAETGLGWPRSVWVFDPWECAEAAMAGLSESVRGCPSTGWPGGYRGRRDAWLLVLTRGLRLCRRDALAIRSPDVLVEGGRFVVAGQVLERGDDPVVCSACVAARWLAIVSEQWAWGRGRVREVLTVATRGAGHDCARLGALLVPAHVPLVPAIDQHGWATDWRAMSPRAVTMILASRCAPGVGEWHPEQAETQDPGVAFDETTFERLEAACVQADAVNDRIGALLAETETMLGRRVRRRD